MNVSAVLYPLIPTLVGFVSGWVLFELTDWRRRSRTQSELRRALVAELENSEVVASVNLAKYAKFYLTDEEISFAGSVIRWFLTTGRERIKSTGTLDDLPETPETIQTLTDKQLVQLYSEIDETLGSKLIFPIVESTLAGNLSGLTAQQMTAVSMVRWHAHLLAQTADHMAEAWRMSFTVTDEHNHPRVIQNHDKWRRAYALRVRVLLTVIRKALAALA